MPQPQLIECRARFPYRQDGPLGPVDVPAGEPVRVTAEELAQDRARRFRLLLTLEEERAARQAEEARRAELERQGIIETRDHTAELILQLMQAQRPRGEAAQLTIEEAWEAAGGAPLGPE